MFFEKINFTSLKEANVNLSFDVNENFLFFNFSSDKNINGTITIFFNDKIVKKYSFSGKNVSKKVFLEEKYFDRFDNNFKIIVEYYDFDGKKTIVKEKNLFLEKNFENYVKIFFNKILLLFN